VIASAAGLAERVPAAGEISATVGAWFTGTSIVTAADVLLASSSS
jgi:hypothetical protein